MNRFKPAALSATIVAALLLSACGGGSSADPPDSGQAAAAPQGAAVTVKTFSFQPDPLEVEVGETVKWTNEDSAVHTVTAGTREKPDEKAFDIELAESGGTGEHKFTEAGTYEYFCSLHSGDGMTATVVVK